jgi:drug/metabolite transporter (DMT)-like permease
MSPLWLTGFFYTGSLLGILPGFLPLLGMRPTSTASFLSIGVLKRAEKAALAASILIGGVIAPILLVIGLTRFPASRGSLLMNAESVFTVLFAYCLFRERITVRLLVGAALGSTGCAVASLNQAGGGAGGALFFLSAALLWALDTNILRWLSGVNPLAVTVWKGIGSAMFLIPAAAFTGPPPHSATLVLWALGVGSFGYGFSLICFLRSIRRIGVSRTGAWFGFSPFVGATLSIVLLKEPVTLGFLAASGILFLAVLILQDSRMLRVKRTS